MAECRRFICSECGKAIEAWSDGNPFYLDQSGEKVYAYHPNHTELAKCIANDSPHLCLQCGGESKIDSRIAVKACPRCHAEEVISTFLMEGIGCPKCKEGKFVWDKGFTCIS